MRINTRWCRLSSSCRVAIRLKMCTYVRRSVCCVWDIDNLRAEWLHDSDHENRMRARARACVRACMRVRVCVCLYACACTCIVCLKPSYPPNLPEMRNWGGTLSFSIQIYLLMCVLAFYLLSIDICHSNF